MASGQSGGTRRHSRSAAGIPCVTRELAAAGVSARMASHLWLGGISVPGPIVTGLTVRMSGGLRMASGGIRAPRNQGPFPLAGPGRGSHDRATPNGRCGYRILSGSCTRWAVLGAVICRLGWPKVTLSVVIGYFRLRQHRPADVRWPAWQLPWPGRACHAMRRSPLPDPVGQDEAGATGREEIPSWVPAAGQQPTALPMGSLLS